MTVYKGPNAFRDGMFKTPKQPSVITPRAPTSGVYRRNADAFNNKFPKSRYKDQSGGQSSGGLESSGGGGGYVAEAVALDGNTWLICDSLTAPDSNVLSYSFSFRADPAGTHERLFWIIDPENDYLSYSEILRNNNEGRLQTTTYSAEENDDFRLDSIVPGAPSNYRDGEWHTCVVTLQTGNASGENIAKVYMDRQDVTQVITDNGPFTIATDGKPFWMFYDDGGAHGADGYSFVGDFCNFWWAVGTSLLVDGDIPVATLNKFFDTDNKPVDPSNWPAGAQIKLIGGASTFATNQGTGGAFTVAAGSLTDATTSPSD